MEDFYESPQIEVIEVQVEQGFATSDTGQLFPFEDGGQGY